ncbi:IS110 family transposase (plasmid) [Alicyclobacillus fastidiosus]|uniref:IS110 family transposase n=1 Tax=Alicyclobacillus fastidiosus TaxID=392011 RepID=A0ABY6ZPT2_9BACL|nr:IS110 family transposase [Alicyclobacillus fastidiosus]WAH40289.1 IS110 family transposase [Alicyclobacillus fastidiosus]WAH44983.1 IS110 family transposase [Alicyclobacillus fastidiosus]GMA61667.1 IS110 family transposase [Alicyclobacillus fastidiosus]GMA66275.1 IS110 family transposase [Alicyclobacillus fastidiosus]GMA66324.1 IS110 family transposase [Alicyclobacillus fastidiosus]
MNPVIGLDVAKGESIAQAFLDKRTPHGKQFTVVHTHDGLEDFHEFLREVEAKSGLQPTIILEATGHYHAPIVRFLDDQNYVYIMVNPLIAYSAKKSSLRKVKTDAADAYSLCELFYKEDFEPFKKRGLQLLNLRSLTRQHAAITRLSVQTKLQFQAVLDHVFPEYRGVFGDLYSKVSLRTLLEFPTADSVLNVTEAKLTKRVSELCKSRSERWSREKAREIIAAATRNPFRNVLLEGYLLSLKMYIQMILQYQEHLSHLEKTIDALAEEIEEYKIIQSIPGVGEKIAATIISEIGEIDRFNHPKKLVAFAGIDPSVHSSGKFTATINRITKRGSSRLRHSLYCAVECGLRKTRNKRLKTFYDKKRAEGKPYKQAVIACVNKLIHWIYVLLKRKELFVDLN